MSKGMNREATGGAKVFWRSLEMKADADRAAEHAGSDVIKRTVDARELTRLNRRNFMTLSGAIGALAGLEGCIRRPAEKILPYSEAPDDVTLGNALHYATAVQRRGETVGLLVTANEGRPTKIEGNPVHPASRGATDIFTQSRILDLYDADRAQQPSKSGIPKSYADFDGVLGDAIAAALKGGGKGLRVLMTPTNSPTVQALRQKVKARFPQAGFHTYAPLNDDAERQATQLAFGQPLVVRNDFERARIVLSLDSDFMLTETGSVEATKGYARARTMNSAADEPNRLYVVEPSMSVTGSNADHRLRLKGSAIGAYLKALAAELVAQGVPVGTTIGSAISGSKAPAGVPETWIKVVAKELASHRGQSLVVAGSRQPAAVHALVFAINRALGNPGKTVSYAAAPDIAAKPCFDDIKALAADMAGGKVDTLVILGGNPVHDAPVDVGFRDAIKKVNLSIAFTDRADETADLASWHVPRAHELESWGDLVARDGRYSVQQPLIAPLFEARSDLEVLATLAGEEGGARALVQATAAARGAGDSLAFDRLVQKGVSDSGASQVLAGIAVNESAVVQGLSTLQGSGDGLEVVFLPDNKVWDGDQVNNTWLLEIPDPITRITWDNAALIGPSTAKQLGVENGDMIRVSVGGASVEIVAWVQPGQADGVVGLPLGWGRSKAGQNAVGAGFDVYPLRTTAAPHYAGGAKVEKLGSTYPISQTQEHDFMEGRPLAVDATVAEYRERPQFGQWASPDFSAGPLWQTVDYTKGLQWGMVIDLNNCTGCSACVAACQAENNIPVVGKDQVSRGREMSWMRIDRYYVGEDIDDPEVAYQPVGCQHCEEAPCENVCPVNATSHSPEGLNDIAYNRCIGTRYCMNNCPYKVRRFNFLNFNLDIPETEQMQFNPEVSIRFRGVIEKCTYCVQRIQKAKIQARREGRAVVDGEVTVACQQVCPADAISFGDINDPNTAVSKKRCVDRHYGLLSDVGTRPRTRFLGKVRNPSPEMKG